MHASVCQTWTGNSAVRAAPVAIRALVLRSSATFQFYDDANFLIVGVGELGAESQFLFISH